MLVSLESFSARHPSAKEGARAAVGNLSLQFRAGEQVAIIGPSGSGKTTLLHAIACALKPSAGCLKLNEQNPWSLGTNALQTLRAQLFLAPQVPPLPPRQRVVTAVLAGRLPKMSFFQSLRSLFYPIGIEQANDALAKFDLSEKLFERVDRLSGGERQRVGLARCLVSEASLVIVDEPLSALDPTRSVQALSALVEDARNRNATLLCSLHQVPLALQHFSRIIALREGTLAFDLPASQVTTEQLQELYANQLHELTSAVSEVTEDASLAAAKPAVMHCR
jgi:phosphonate transport system ATP-binding protein